MPAHSTRSRRSGVLYRGAAALALAALGWTQAGAQVVVPSRGQLLYENHCIACHDKQVHWRRERASADLRSLRAEVRRWQARALLNWSDEEIDDVTQHLNTTVYRFPPSRG